LGEEKEITLELKILADVGIIGLPNAGKSTLLNALTRAKAEVGSYPFTTLEPNLGVLEFGSWKFEARKEAGGSKMEKKNLVSSLKSQYPASNLQPLTSIILADIPGLIEGASKGRGLGDEFLRHIERVKVLIHVIDPQEGGKDSYSTIRKELGEYSPELLNKPEIVVINKVDLVNKKGVISKVKTLDAIPISALTGEGLEELKKRIVNQLNSESVNQEDNATTLGTKRPTLTFTIDDLPNKRIIFRK